MVRYFSFFVTLILFVSACAPHTQTNKPQPPVKKEKKTSPTKTQTQENNTTKKELQTFAFRVVTTPKHTRIRILNIRPKYHHNIQLPKGKYHIEVTKKGYKKYTKWIYLREPLTLHVTLQPSTKQHLQHKVKQSTQHAITWDYNNEYFYTYYDKKTKLIWALQSSYLDYVIKNKPKHLLKNTLYIKGKSIPKIKKTKLDTLVYAGNLRQNNAVVLYKKSRQYSSKEHIASLENLHVNTQVHTWHIPFIHQLTTHNPFQKYQKHFEAIWLKGNIVKLNIPVIAKNSSLTTQAFFYEKNNTSGFYDGKPSSKKYFVKHPQNVALLIPVRKISSKLDTLVYNTQKPLGWRYKKIVQITHSKNKAIQTLLGDPKLKDIYWDTHRKKLGATLYSTTNNFTQKVYISVAPNNSYKTYKDKILHERIIPHVTLELNNNKLTCTNITFTPNTPQEENAYIEARKSQNINYYREYLRLYPNAPQAKKIQKLLDKEMLNYKKKKL